MYVPNLWCSQTVFVACKVLFFERFVYRRTFVFKGCQGFALYAMWSLKVRKVEKIKNEGCHEKDIVTSYIYFRRISKILQKKNHHELLISHAFQAWSNLSIFCIIVLEELVKTHLRFTENKTFPQKGAPWTPRRKRWIQAWTQAWPLPPVKWLLRSQQWDFQTSPNFVQLFF